MYFTKIVLCRTATKNHRLFNKTLVNYSKYENFLNKCSKLGFPMYNCGTGKQPVKYVMEEFQIRAYEDTDFLAIKLSAT